MKQAYYTKVLLLLVSAGIILSSCRKHDYYQVNPNEPSAATPALLLANICISVFNYDPQASAYASRQLTYYEPTSIFSAR